MTLKKSRTIMTCKVSRTWRLDVVFATTRKPISAAMVRGVFYPKDITLPRAREARPAGLRTDFLWNGKREHSWCDSLAQILMPKEWQRVENLRKAGRNRLLSQVVHSNTAGSPASGLRALSLRSAPAGSANEDSGEISDSHENNADPVARETDGTGENSIKDHEPPPNKDGEAGESQSDHDLATNQEANANGTQESTARPCNPQSETELTSFKQQPTETESANPLPKHQLSTTGETTATRAGENATTAFSSPDSTSPKSSNPSQNPPQQLPSAPGGPAHEENARRSCPPLRSSAAHHTKTPAAPPQPPAPSSETINPSTLNPWYPSAEQNWQWPTPPQPIPPTAAVVEWSEV